MRYLASLIREILDSLGKSGLIIPMMLIVAVITCRDNKDNDNNNNNDNNDNNNEDLKLSCCFPKHRAK